jgi:hypothetical protein
MSDFEWENLPDDPELAFVQLEKHFRGNLESGLNDSNNGHHSDWLQIEYANHVIAAANALGFDFLKDWKIPSHQVGGVNIYDFYKDFSTAVSGIVLQININSIRQHRRYSVAFSPADKERIRHYAHQIKTILDTAELPIAKKDDLFKKLNRFLAEVDKTRTDLQAISDLTIGLAHIGGETARELEPINKLLHPILRIFGRYRDMEDAQRQLPGPRDHPRIEPPQLQLSGPSNSGDLDDEIPF